MSEQKTSIKSKSKWSQNITENSRALELEDGVFTWSNPTKIANSLKNSALKSKNKKGTPFQSAMSMLNFYINRGGKNLNKDQKKVLEEAKIKLRDLFDK